MAAAKSKKIVFIFFLVIFTAGLLFILFNESGVVKYVKLKSQLDSLTIEIQKAEAVNNQLRAEIDSLKRGDPAKIERVAREKYGLIRQGEKVYRMKEK
jgi:cell division protein FtsL